MRTKSNPIMKLKFIFAYFLLVTGVLFTASGCETCDVAGGSITFSPDQQFLSITYLVDSNDSNFCQTVYNPNNVRVMFNDNGGRGQFFPLAEDLSDGKIGPFNYTTEPEMARKGVFYHYQYIVTKDTFGLDTFDVKFYPRVDECEEFWSVVEFYMNGVLLPAGTDITICDLTVRE